LTSDIKQKESHLSWCTGNCDQVRILFTYRKHIWQRRIGK